MDKRFWGFLLVVAVVLGGVFFINNSRSSDTSGGSGGLTNHVAGKGTTGVKLVEYGDFQCPACGNYEPIVQQVRAKYGDQISFQFRHFPLYQIHKNAIAGSRAAEAASKQGKFWEMHDLLYRYQSEWVESSDPFNFFKKYASTIKLDQARFETDFKSKAVNDSVQADLAEGTKLKVDSTPTFFLDGKKISTPAASVEAFSKIIDAEIAKKGGSTETPTSAATAAPAEAQ